MIQGRYPAGFRGGGGLSRGAPTDLDAGVADTVPRPSANVCHGPAVSPLGSGTRAPQGARELGPRHKAELCLPRSLLPPFPLLLSIPLLLPPSPHRFAPRTAVSTNPAPRELGERVGRSSGHKATGERPGWKSCAAARPDEGPAGRAALGIVEWSSRPRAA